ncbi:hypothetical protein KC218_24785, partial [Mycobacterium tuberculosis]|nr:hypothetical protein [Mycobacterium tuberculosis]
VSHAAGPGAFTLTGYGFTVAITMPAAGASYALAFGNNVLVRTGADFDLVYGGVGHYLEELEEQRRLAEITRKTPAPVVRPMQPAFRP